MPAAIAEPETSVTRAVPARSIFFIIIPSLVLNYDADRIAHRRPKGCTYGATHRNIRKYRVTAAPPCRHDVTRVPRPACSLCRIFGRKTRVIGGHFPEMLHPPTKKAPSLRLGLRFTGSRCVKESVTTAELKRQAGADVVDHHLVPDIGRTGRRIRIGLRAQIGVAIFHPAEQIVGEPIFKAGARGPAGVAAGAVGEERREARGRISGRPGPPPPTGRAEEQPILDRKRE